MISPLHISILLDEPFEWGPGFGRDVGEGELRFDAGAKVSGTIQIVVLEDVDFRAFRIGFLWHTEGKGNRMTGGGGAVQLADEGNWRAGERITFPFRLKVPRGPISYSGKILRLKWHLEARVDRSMLRSDINEMLPVEIVPSPLVQKWNLGPKPQTKTELEAVKRGLGGLWLSLSMALLLGSVLWGALQNWSFLPAEKVLVVLMFAGGFLLMLTGIWGRLASGKLGEPTVHLNTTDLSRGEEIRYSLVMRPEQRTELRSLEAILECEERVVHGHGQYRSNHRRVVFEKRITLAKDLTIEARKGLRKRGSLTLPEDVPPSFSAPDNQIVWWLRFQGDIVGWPDWKEPVLLTVRP